MATSFSELPGPGKHKPAPEAGDVLRVRNKEIKPAPKFPGRAAARGTFWFVLIPAPQPGLPASRVLGWQRSRTPHLILWQTSFVKKVNL